MNLLKFSLILLGVVSLTGCASFLRTPSNLAHIKLETVDSPVVLTETVWLERKDDIAVVTGYVVKRLDVKDTTATHLDITLLDGTGSVLREIGAHFEPRQIPRRYRRPDYATYRVPLDPLPASTARIIVRAHEGNHS
jgi:hypothetical protein